MEAMYQWFGFLKSQLLIWSGSIPMKTNGLISAEPPFFAVQISFVHFLFLC